MVWLASCHRAAPEAGTPVLDVRPLASFAAQRMVVTPTSHVRAGDTLGWVQSLGGAPAAARQLDSAIARVLEGRGLAGRWILPADLARAYERNRTYATDPYQQASAAVRVPAFVTGARYGEPLSSQLRTMVALHEDARFVIMPIELRFERIGTQVRGVLRTALVDPRTAEALWVGDVTGDAATAAASALGSVASRFADLFAAP